MYALLKYFFAKKLTINKFLLGDFSGTDTFSQNIQIFDFVFCSRMVGNMLKHSLPKYFTKR